MILKILIFFTILIIVKKIIIKISSNKLIKRIKNNLK